MKIFVTGITGFLGSHIANAFVTAGHEVVGVDDLSGGDPLNVPEGACWTIASCLNPDSFRDLLRGSDVVYHCAASAYDGLSVFSPAFVFRDTAQASVEMVTAAIAADVGRFVYCSSMARYGRGIPPFSEEDEARPVTPYGIAKLSAEQVIRALFDAHGGEWVIAVPHNIIGPRQNFTDPYRNVAEIMINRMLQGEQPIIYGDGSHRRCFTFISDAVTPLQNMASGPESVRQIINIGPDEQTSSILELAQEIADLMNFSLQPIHVPDRLLEVDDARCSSEKARHLLGYHTQVTPREGLSEMVDWMSAVGPRPFRYNRTIELRTDSTPETWSRGLI